MAASALAVRTRALLFPFPSAVVGAPFKSRARSVSMDARACKQTAFAGVPYVEVFDCECVFEPVVYCAFSFYFFYINYELAYLFT